MTEAAAPVPNVQRYFVRHANGAPCPRSPGPFSTVDGARQRAHHLNASSVLEGRCDGGPHIVRGVFDAAEEASIQPGAPPAVLFAVVHEDGRQCLQSGAPHILRRDAERVTGFHNVHGKTGGCDGGTHRVVPYKIDSGLYEMAHADGDLCPCSPSPTPDATLLEKWFSMFCAAAGIDRACVGKVHFVRAVDGAAP